jgi:hypothetical protein
MGWYTGTRAAWASGKGRRGSHFTVGSYATVDLWFGLLPLPSLGASVAYDFL